ncbi:MAG TPA: sugar phosphate isomerase/epimerase [Spirochaetia bacterium]|nr:sugar phosphate isomerase/epimerase [Spirochaetia bacterium]
MGTLAGKIAAQLWTVRGLLGDEKSLASALARVRSIGYDAVELIGLGAIPHHSVRRILDDSGLVACSAHADSQLILSDPGAVATMLHALGCGSVAYPYPRNQDVSSPEGVQRLCRQLSSAASLFHSEGISFSYHNHGLELQRLGERTALQVIMEQTDPRLVGMELDTYWLQAGGVDPVAWINRCKGRAALLHLKDYRVNADGKPLFGEIGAGNLDWDKILSAAGAAGTRWLIVEQDDHWTGGDPMASLQTSWEYLSRK